MSPPERLTYPFCLAPWVATGFAVGLVFVPRATRLVAATFTTVAIGDLLQNVYAISQQKAAGKRPYEPRPAEVRLHAAAHPADGDRPDAEGAGGDRPRGDAVDGDGPERDGPERAGADRRERGVTEP